MAEIDLQIVEAEEINVKLVEGIPINVTIGESIYSTVESIFDPDENGLRIIKLYIKNGKVKVKYEDGE